MFSDSKHTTVFHIRTLKNIIKINTIDNHNINTCNKNYGGMTKS